jgi:hypothetical protein
MMAVSALVLLSFPASAYDAASSRAHCEAEWKTDFRMVKYCVDQQSEAGAKLDSLFSLHGVGTVGRGILDMCTAEWGVDLQMVAYCADQQFDAVRWLSGDVWGDIPGSVSSVISKQCDREWADDYQMVKYCIEQQSDAWRSLQ